MICTSCKIFDGSVDTCARCGKIRKQDIGKFIRGDVRVYLNELNRCKSGRHPKIQLDLCDIIHEENLAGQPMGDLAQKYKVSKSTIYNVIRRAENKLNAGFAFHQILKVISNSTTSITACSNIKDAEMICMD